MGYTDDTDQSRGSNLIEADVQDWILLPVVEVEVPPLGFVNLKALGFHRSAQQIAMPSLQRSAAGIIRIRAVGCLVLSAHHLDRLLRFQVIQRDINGGAAIVT